MKKPRIDHVYPEDANTPGKRWMWRWRVRRARDRGQEIPTLDIITPPEQIVGPSPWEERSDDDTERGDRPDEQTQTPV